LPTPIDGQCEDVVRWLEPIGDLVIEREVTALVRGQRMTVNCRRGAGHDGIKLQE
jgi:hypothetical protein